MADLEKAVEAALVNGIYKMGGVAYKFSSPQRRGVPDRIVVLPGKIIFVELKTLKGKLSSGQKREIQRLLDLGCDVRVLFGKEQVDNFLMELEIL